MKFLVKKLEISEVAPEKKNIQVEYGPGGYSIWYKGTPKSLWKRPCFRNIDHCLIGDSQVRKISMVYVILVLFVENIITIIIAYY